MTRLMKGDGLVPVADVDSPAAFARSLRSLGIDALRRGGRVYMRPTQARQLIAALS